MPLHLEPRDVSSDLEHFRSVLIVWCPICPPMSLAMEHDSPFIELFKRDFKTEAFEDYIESIRRPLEQRGVRTSLPRKRLILSVPLPLRTAFLSYVLPWIMAPRSTLREPARPVPSV
jgi:hypothetical protein